MHVQGQKLVIVGDRVLLRPEEGESVSRAGLILPATVADRDEVQSGRVVGVGPGVAVGAEGLDLSEDWESTPSSKPPRYVALQARVGDLAVFHRKAAVEIVVANERLLVVPHGALLVLLRDEHDIQESTGPQ